VSVAGKKPFSGRCSTKPAPSRFNLMRQVAPAGRIHPLNGGGRNSSSCFLRDTLAPEMLVRRSQAEVIPRQRSRHATAEAAELPAGPEVSDKKSSATNWFGTPMAWHRRAAAPRPVCGPATAAHGSPSCDRWR